MIRDATAADLEPLRDLLARANDSPYDLPSVAEEKCFAAGCFGPARTRLVETGGELRGVAVSSGDYLRLIAVARSDRGKGIGSALLDDAHASIIAAEPGNYFTPGVVEPRFFLDRGYEEAAETWNLHVELRDPRSEIAALPTSDRQSRIAMYGFIEEHFGPIWRFEAERAAIAHSIEGVGFAVADANNRGLGTFGPAGVAEEFRGRGFGRQLVLACLADLRRLGYSRAIIQWTGALEFYRKSCGAEPAHRFVTLRKPK
ncbi:MAG: hypothetical protein NVSMB68_09530 [Thermoanaerobaculia bacterium]